MDNVRFYIESLNISRTEVAPSFKGAFSYKQESGEIYYRFEAKDKFKFNKKADYDLIKDVDECEDIKLSIEIYCSGSYVEFWKGMFTIFDSTVNKTLCFIETKIEPDDKYKCFDDELKTTINVFTSGTVVTVTAIGGTYESQTCIDTVDGADCSDYYSRFYLPNDSCLTNAADWCLKENIVLVDGVDPEGENPECENPFFLTQRTTWHRETATIPCVGGASVEPPFSSEWLLLSDDCVSSSESTWWRCPSSSSGSVVGDYDKGRTLEGVLNKILTEMGCGLTVKSDFFNINPLNDSPTNLPYTQAAKYCHNITMHQKSDIKRKNATNGSSFNSWTLKMDELLNDLRTLFNVWFDIDGNSLVLEHYSFFQSIEGKDLSDYPAPDEYDHSGNENVRKQFYSYMDEDASSEFLSKVIDYGCGTEDKDERCKIISTDIGYIEMPENDEKISDKGFVLISNTLFGGNYIINSANAPFSFPELHKNFHTYGRLFRSGKLNNIQQDFDSWLPYRKQQKFKINLCCDENFDPSDTIKTSLGENYATPTRAVVDNAEYNVFTNKLELTLKY